MRRLTLATGIAIGYVLGTRAGVERYEAIVRAARGFRERPAVQAVSGVVAAKASAVLHGGRGTPG